MIFLGGMGMKVEKNHEVTLQLLLTTLKHFTNFGERIGSTLAEKSLINRRLFQGAGENVN